MALLKKVILDTSITEEGEHDTENPQVGSCCELH